MLHAVAKRVWRCRSLLVVGGAAVLVGCASWPVQEMSDARQAVAAAVQAGGDQKAAVQMQEARAALLQAEAALQKLQYKLARHLAQQARAKAIEAQQAAGATS